MFLSILFGEKPLNLCEETVQLADSLIGQLGALARDTSVRRSVRASDGISFDGSC